jgi:hypothetical protein
MPRLALLVLLATVVVHWSCRDDSDTDAVVSPTTSSAAATPAADPTPTSAPKTEEHLVQYFVPGGINQSVMVIETVEGECFAGSLKNGSRQDAWSAHLDTPSWTRASKAGSAAKNWLAQRTRG